MLYFAIAAAGFAAGVIVASLVGANNGSVD